LICTRLQALLPECAVAILGDTSYGSCCVDEVAAEHVRAQCVVHFGPTCFSATERVPALFSLPKQPLDCEAVVGRLAETLANDREAEPCVAAPLVFYAAHYHHVVDRLAAALAAHLPAASLVRITAPLGKFVSGPQGGHIQAVGQAQLFCGRTLPGSVDAAAEQVDGQQKDVGAQQTEEAPACGREQATLQDGAEAEPRPVVWIGNAGPLLNNLICRYSSAAFYQCTTVGATGSDGVTPSVRRLGREVTKTMMRRYVLVEKLRDAEVVGLLVGTLAVAHYREVLDRLRAILKASGKKFYTMVVGKLNPEKLANWPEIEIWVQVACPFQTLGLANPADFYKPICAPYDLLVALVPGIEWTGEYRTDFADVLHMAEKVCVRG
jgi:diphthamide biosynthesis protein 2